MRQASYTEWQRHWTALDHTAAMEPARRWRHRLIRRRALQFAADRIIDLGCGRGEVLGALAQTRPSATLIGVDGSRSPHLNALPQARFLQADLEDPRAPWLGEALADGPFDLVIASEVLEHLDDDRAALRRATRLLAPDGHLVITLPAGPLGHIDRYFGHRRHYTRARVKLMLESADLEPVLHESRGFPFFNIYRLGLVIGGGHLTRRALDTRRARPLLVTRVLFRLFDVLLRVELPIRRGGWQHVLVARRRGVA